MVVSVQFNMEYFCSIIKFLISVIQDRSISLEMFLGMPLTIAQIVHFDAENELFWVKTKRGWARGVGL